MKRSIITIDEEKCNGCGLCVPDCPEGALQVIDGKVRLVSDLFCDGLGACLKTCPEGALFVEEREAEPYSERKVMENVAKHGANVIKAHLHHLKEHGEMKYLREAVEYLQEKGIPVPEYEERPRPWHADAPGPRQWTCGQQGEKVAAAPAPASGRAPPVAGSAEAPQPGSALFRRRGPAAGGRLRPLRVRQFSPGPACRQDRHHVLPQA